MKMIQDPEEFIGQLAIWVSKNRTMEGFNIVELTSVDGVQYEPVVYDYVFTEHVFVNDKGPYKTMQGAMGAIGAVLDRIEKL